MFFLINDIYHKAKKEEEESEVEREGEKGIGSARRLRSRKRENDRVLVSSSNRLKMLTQPTNKSHYKTSYPLTPNPINNSSSPPLDDGQK